jgi:protein-disulfide isomerase
MSRKTWIILGVTVALIAGGAYYVLGRDGGMQTVAAASAKGYEPLPTDHTMGNPQAKVVLIEYASPTCPVCANFMLNFFPKLKRDYIDTGKIFYVYRTFLRGPDDAMAEKLARCLPKDKYMSFTDSLFRNQSKWDYEFGVPSPQGVHTALIQLAGEEGMNAADADRCIASTTEEAAISKVGEDGVAKYAVNATPTFVINGQAQAGFEDFFERLDRALSGK